jgi:signal transduction histidine kinase/CheY-like chemotaxis protein
MAEAQRRVRVLLLEDSPLDAELAVARLEKAGLALEVSYASDRATYFEQLQAREYDLILADYALPDFDGLAALEAARALSPHLPFIFISGRVGEEVAIETLQRGATDYVLKQRLERLVPAVTRALKDAEEHAARMLVEQRYRESEMRFRHVIDALPQMVWIATAEGDLIYTNKAWVEGVPSGTASWLDESVIHPDDRAMCVVSWRRAVDSGEAFSCECRLSRGSDRSWRWHLIRMVPLSGTRTDADGSACVDWLGTATDLQEQKLNEEALRTAEKLAVTGRMIAGIAHEINNPLESVSNLIFLARIEARDNPRVLEYLDVTENELARVAAITKQTLQFYRDPLTPTPIDAREILEDVMRLFSTRLAAKRVRFSLEVEKGIIFEAIKGEIRQVLINLVGNSIDAVPAEGEIGVVAQIVNQGREMVQIEIHDNGMGLAAAQLDRLFQPFFSTKGAHGTGLGLWVSKGIVEKHEGSIRLASQSENGLNRTTATVLLPLRASQELMLNQSVS